MEDSRLEYNTIYKSDPVVTHLPSTTDGDEIVIRLNYQNCSVAHFPQMSKCIVLWDSGASASLISEATIKSSRFLSGILPESALAMNFTVGNGTKMKTTRTLTFGMVVQGQTLQVRAYIAPSLGGFDIVAGNDVLRKLEANICFKKGLLRWKSKGVIAKFVKPAILKPGESRVLTIKARIPGIVKNSEMYFKSTRFMSQFMPTNVLLKMYKGTARILVVNPTKRVVKFRADKPIGTVILSDFGKVPSSHDLHYSKVNSVPSETLFSCVPSTVSKMDSKQQELFKRKVMEFPHLDPDDPRLTKEDLDILRDNINLENNCMSPKTLEKFWEVIKKRKAAFAIHDELGNVDVEIKLNLKDESPFYIRPFPASESEKEVIDKEIEKLVKMGVLKLGKGSYVSPMLLVKKKSSDGKPALRPVTDFRYLNSRIMPLHYCSPLLRDALQLIGSSGATIFSTLDLKNAFFSLKVHPDSQKFLTIAPYPSGRTYQYLRMPQGLSISPTEWSDKIADILSELPKHTQYCLGIADDIIVYSKNQQEHLEHVAKVLELFEKHGLKISVSKCQFFRQNLEYMGHKITTKEGKPAITPQKSKVDSITKMERPKTPKQAKSFVGMVAFLSMYLPKLQILLAPFHHLTKKNSKFLWTDELQKNFEIIKESLQKSPVLTLPAREGKFVLYVDSSVIGTGGALFQIQDGKERLLSFYSRKFQDAARNMTISEIECYGILLTIQAYRYLLRSVQFEVVTDHSALLQIHKSKSEPATLRLRKYFEKLSDFNFHLRYKKGKDMFLADHLSRHPTCEVEDDRPIAFSVIYDRLCMKGVTKNQQFDHQTRTEKEEEEEVLEELAEEEEEMDTHLLVTTRSSTRATGEALSTGLSAPTRATRQSQNCLPSESTGTTKSSTIKDTSGGETEVKSPAPLFDTTGSNLPETLCSDSQFQPGTGEYLERSVRET